MVPGMDQLAELKNAVPEVAMPDDVMGALDQLGVPHILYHHEAVFTVEEAAKVEHDIPGHHCRNLFVRDDKERMFLVSALNHTKIDLKKLSVALGCRRLSFGSAERLYKYLGVKPGSVCAFAVMNDHGRDVTLVLEAEMMRKDIITFHPLLNTMTVSLPPAGLRQFVDHFGHPPVVLEMADLA